MAREAEANLRLQVEPRTQPSLSVFLVAVVSSGNKNATTHLDVSSPVDQDVRGFDVAVHGHEVFPEVLQGAHHAEGDVGQQILRNYAVLSVNLRAKNGSRQVVRYITEKSVSKPFKLYRAVHERDQAAR